MKVINVKSSSTLRDISTQFSKISSEEIDPDITIDIEQFVFNWKTVIQMGKGCVLICVNETNETIGMICGVVEGNGWDNKQLIAKECFWWVKPEYRSKGAGQELLNSFINWAKLKGANDLLMVSLREKPQVEHFYEANGFKLLEKTWIKSIKGVN